MIWNALEAVTSVQNEKELFSWTAGQTTEIWELQ